MDGGELTIQVRRRKEKKNWETNVRVVKHCDERGDVDQKATVESIISKWWLILGLGVDMDIDMDMLALGGLGNKIEHYGVEVWAGRWRVIRGQSDRRLGIRVPVRA